MLSRESASGHESLDYSKLDPGIRVYVERLRDQGFVTTDSGDGKAKAELIAAGYALPFPHVVSVVDPVKMIEEACRMQYVLGSEWTVEATFSTKDETATLLARKDR